MLLHISKHYSLEENRQTHGFKVIFKTKIFDVNIFLLCRCPVTKEKKIIGYYFLSVIIPKKLNVEL